MVLFEDSMACSTSGNWSPLNSMGTGRPGKNGRTANGKMGISRQELRDQDQSLAVSGLRAGPLRGWPPEFFRLDLGLGIIVHKLP